ncbi:LptF/LptG family permease [Planctomicrobium piriforme]|uniref:Lipopolysaccharide export system permease protein n=1 Tax=Planctomicrobium piriforme TaxID=1576369 RepID=A0A1I3S3A3_9PLAN|nr:LptF/LptG family permease [Planctomicrobium piriforme]SFJ53098.1 lipopolysaccharide export system permease protein [Planctomicrobium piriforme]
MTTFDRYLLSRYFHVVFVFCIATIGLFAVVDGFTNLDAFQHKVDEQNGGSLALFFRIGQYYLFQSALILDTAGPTVMVISAMSALALMLRHGEIHPVLAAGVPTYRATFPLAGAMIGVNLLLAVNQELILPNIAHHLQGRHGDLADDTQNAEPQYDYKSKIFVSGSGIVPAEQRLKDPEFLLPTPLLASSFVVLKGDAAYYLPPSAMGPAGWVLENATPRFEDLPLTEAGRRTIIPQPDSPDVFVHMGLSFDQLNRQAANPRLVSTAGLIRKLQQPSSTQLSRRRLEIKLHERLTRPLLTLIGLYTVIPLIIRRERMSVMQQVTNIAACAGALGLVFAGVMGAQMLGESGILRPEQAVWGPLVAAGGFAGWLSGVVRT